MEKKRKNGTKLLWIVGLVAAIFVINAFIGEDAPKGNVSHAENTKEWKELLYKNAPGLKKAEAEGSVKEIKKDIQIPNSEKQIHMEQMWLNGKELYALYSIDADEKTGMLKNPGNKLPYIVSVDFMHSTLPTEPKDTANKPPKGVFYDHQMHYVLKMNSFDDFGEIPEVHLDGEYPMRILFKMNGDIVVMDDVQFPIKFDYKEPILHTWNINKTIQAGERKITIEKIEVFEKMSFLYLKYDSAYKEESLDGVDLVIHSDQKEQRLLRYQMGLNGEEKVYKLGFESFNKTPKSIGFYLNGISWFGNEEVQFDLNDVQKMMEGHEEGRILHSKVYEKNNAKIFLENMTLNNQGFNIFIGLDPGRTSDKNEPYLDDQILTPGYGGTDGKYRIPLQVTVQNEKGEYAQVSNVFRSDGSTANGVTVPFYFYELAKDMHVKINHLKYKIDLSEDVTATIKEENK
ncbi:hypothetical protein [Falsibacillus pallidus]|uniref:DUF4179 domain-containing protein n=1 Tax=Falsibacillus pallidus TaxID=493781 RepID=A0A370GP12_9BACI|nr:hypothetical protein [Falsibacillus pallidus]RDI45407.1 hypothetical protein DFR59_10231 [Falsibacillus pallidus]